MSLLPIVSVKVLSGEGSDERIEVAEAHFEYRKDSLAPWPVGKVAVTTNFEGMKDRHILCE
jgi:hypothetical protein